MKTPLLLLTASLLSLTARAADSQSIDLGNGSTIEVKDGKVSVKASAEGGGNQSASSSVSSSSNGDGTTTTIVTSERNGQKVTRTLTIDKDGKVTVGGGGADQPALPLPPAQAAPPASGAWMGVHTVPVTDAVRAQVDLPQGQGIAVEFIAENGPAAQAGLAVNDILLRMNSEPLDTAEAFREKLRALKPGAQVSVTYIRKGQPANATVTLGQRPPESPAGDKVTNEAERLLRKMQEKQGSNTRRTVVVGADGKTTVTESSHSSSSTGGGSSSSSSGGGSGKDAFDALLSDPNVPEEMKEQVRRMRSQMEKAQPDSPARGSE
jgi:PDZ domain